jgi:hypothetical protein
MAGICLIFAFLSALAWPMLPWQHGQQTDIAITSLDEKYGI